MKIHATSECGKSTQVFSELDDKGYTRNAFDDGRVIWEGSAQDDEGAWVDYDVGERKSKMLEREWQLMWKEKDMASLVALRDAWKDSVQFCHLRDKHERQVEELTGKIEELSEWQTRAKKWIVTAQALMDGPANANMAIIEGMEKDIEEFQKKIRLQSEGKIQSDCEHLSLEVDLVNEKTELGKRVEELEAQLDDLTKKGIEKHLWDSFHVMKEKGELKVWIQSGFVPLMGGLMAETFKEYEGINYVSWDVESKELGPLTMSLQRCQGISPASKAMMMEKRADRLRSKLIDARREWTAIHEHEMETNYYYDFMDADGTVGQCHKRADGTWSQAPTGERPIILKPSKRG